MKRFLLCTVILILLVMQIREFEYNPETQDSRKQELEKLMQDQDTLRSSLLQWCYASYGEVLNILLQCSASVGDFCVVFWNLIKPIMT